MNVQCELDVLPFSTPDTALAKTSKGLIPIDLHAIPADTLAEMCEAWSAAVFKAAGHQPADPGFCVCGAYKP